MGAFAEFERNLIKERVQAGVARARKNGKTFGRPRRDDLDLLRARRLRRAGQSYDSIAQALGCGKGTVIRLLGQRGK